MELVNVKNIIKIFKRSAQDYPSKSSRYSEITHQNGCSRQNGELRVSISKEEDQLTYSWRDVNVFYYAKTNSRSQIPFWGSKKSEERHILKNVNGICHPGELLAIMGASGAGKTTLLNVLTQRNIDNVTINGNFSVNGRPVNPDMLTRNSAYVQQEELFTCAFTVREQLVFQALLRMGARKSYEERLQRVEDIINELGLSKCANTKIGFPNGTSAISGGERKRLSFACEILTNPGLLFCDEPTSGLDSFMAQNVVSVMKKMAMKGKTILSTIHQPSSEVYAMFDRVLLMAEGRVAFLGDADAAYQFFSRLHYPCPSKYNPADHYIEVLSVEPKNEKECFRRINKMCAKFLNEDGSEVRDLIHRNENEEKDSDLIRTVLPSKSIYKSSWWTQFKILTWRSWLEVIRDSSLIKIRPLQLVVLAFLLGLLFYNQPLNDVGVSNINGLLFILLLNMTFQNATAVIHTFCGSRALMLREHHGGMYRIDAYFLAKNLVEFPLFVFYIILYSSIISYLVGLNITFTHYFFYVGTLLLVSQCAISYAYMISCGSKSTSTALALLIPPIIPLLILGGFFINKRSVPAFLHWVQYLSWFNFGNEALLINQWKEVKNLTCSGARRCFQDGEDVLLFFGYNDISPYFDIGFLLILCVSFRLLAFFLLWLNSRKRSGN